MPKKTSKATAETGSPTSQPFGTGLPLAAGAVAIQAWSEVGTEALRFLWDRLQQDVRTQNALLACTSLEELRKVQAEFFTAAQQQYADEARKVLDILVRSTAEGLKASSGARRYDDVPL